MNNEEQSHLQIDLNLSGDGNKDAVQSKMVKNVTPQHLAEDLPALWQHLHTCPICAESYLALAQALHALSAQDIPCDLCVSQIHAAAEQGLSPEEARHSFPETWKHVDVCPLCTHHYIELLHLIHDKAHLEAHEEERALRRTIILVSLVSMMAISLSALTAFWLLKDNEEAIVRRIYAEMSPAVVFIDAMVRTGSGMIIDEAGHILTNNHVVAGSEEIYIRLADGATIKAEVVGCDPATDLAVLRADIAGHPFKVVRFGDADEVQVGDLAIVIGNPFGLERSLTVGHVSALNRILATNDPYGAQITGVIQTDAAINPGNSGGPMFNSEGEVIGVTTMILPGEAGGSAGVGFAIPINTAKWVIREILEKGYVSRPYLGVIGRPLLNFETRRLNLPVDDGLIILQVDPGSPAEKAGLRAGAPGRASANPNMPLGDVIVAVGDQPVHSMSDLWHAIQKHKVGDEVTLKIIRDGREMEIPVTLAEQPPRC